MRKQPLRVSVPVCWVRSSSSNVYQIVKISSVNIKKVKYSNYKLSGQHAPSRSNNSGYNDSQVHGNILTVTPRIHHHFQKLYIYIYICIRRRKTLYTRTLTKSNKIKSVLK